MANTKPTLLRLRTKTVLMLKDAVEQSAHRSMASLADEILAQELEKRLTKDGSELGRVIAAARKG